MFLYELKRNIAQSRGGARNLTDGSSIASLMHFVNASKDIQAFTFDPESDIRKYLDFYLTRPDISLIIYAPECWLFYEPENVDALVLTSSGEVYGYTRYGFEADRDRFSDAKLRLSIPKNALVGCEGIHDILSTIDTGYPDGDLNPSSEYTLTGETIHIIPFDKQGNIYHLDNRQGKFGNWDFAGKVLTSNEETVIITEETNETKSIKQEENKMTTIKNTATAIVAANKSAAVNAAKLEAGTIVLKKVSSIVAKKAPFMVKGYVDTAVGRVVIANLLNFAVAQYAPGNAKAVVAADAAMQAAMLELVQSFNIGEMLDEVLKGVNLANLLEAGETVTE